MDKIEIKYNGEESLSVVVNEDTVLTIKEDAFGWDNFELVEELTKRIARKIPSAEFNIASD